jgi:hypothetical protein
VQFVIGPPTENDRKVEDGTVIAIAEVHPGETVGAVASIDQVVRLPIVGVEQGDWVEEVHVSRKNGDSRYGYILYLPLS